MMTLTQAETEIHKKILEIAAKHKLFVEMPNKPTTTGQPFIAPKGESWSRVSIHYADSHAVGFGNGVCVRDYGNISIQCFTPKGSGMTPLSLLCDIWRECLQSFGVEHLEVYLVHAPKDIQDENFYAKIIRAEFRVN